MASLHSFPGLPVSPKALIRSFRIAGRTLADLAQIERFHGEIAERLYRAGLDPLPEGPGVLPGAIRDMSEARERLWVRVKTILARARTARRRAQTKPDAAMRRHWRDHSARLREEARDHLALLWFCRRRHRALKAAALPSWRKSHAG